MPSTTSSSSRSRPRTPLHETSSSERNQRASGIRLVPYSPPRLSSDGESTGASHEPDAETGRRGSHFATGGPAISNPTKGKTSRSKDEFDTLHPGPSLSSPTSSTTSFGRAKGRGVSGTKLGPNSSGAGPSTPTPVHIRSSYGSNMSGLNADADAQHDVGLGPTSPNPKSRRSNHIALNPDKKTFSIVLKPTNARYSDATDQSLRSPPASYYSTLTSHDGFSFDAPEDDRPISALSSLPDSSVSPYHTPASPVSTVTGEDHTASPWDYRMVGGIRKVASTPDPTDKGKDKEVAADPGPSPLFVLEEVPSSPIRDSSILTAKPSFNSQISGQTGSTVGENTNIEVLGESSPPETDSEGIPDPPSSSDSNYHVLGQSSPAPSHFNPSPPSGLLDTPGSKNFVVHPGTSPATSSLPATVRGPRPQYSDESFVLGEKYSQESLIVPPLNTLGRKSSSERFGYYRQRSRDSLRRANSFSSISSVITQDTGSLFLGSTPNIVQLARTPSASSVQQPTWADPPSLAPPTSRMETQPHVWSSQLSTVLSEDEGSERNSRQLSLTSVPENRGSLGNSSRHSRQMLSISSSLLTSDELSADSLRSHSRSNSGQFMMRGAREGPQPTIRDLDEHGDGLADLHELNHKGSRPRLSHLNHKSSDRSLRSSNSSRTGSFTANSLPHWAK